MMKIQFRKMVYIGVWTAAIFCMLTIFMLSAQPAKTSNDNSKSIVKAGVETTIKVTQAEITEKEKWQLITKINSTGREYMHGVVFFVLGFFVYAIVILWGSKWQNAVFTSFIACVVYGIFDEIHQIIIPGRAFEISDLLMDTTGAAIGIFLSATVYQIYKKALQGRHFCLKK